jgi:hypothetical protein
LKIATDTFPSASITPRYMLSVLNCIVYCPAESTAITR